ncbi:MAG: MBL fold metallo-hydrolase [Bacillota bacterium]
MDEANKKIEIEVLTVSMFATNCYLVSCAKTKEAIIIDPGANGKRIIEKIRNNNLYIKYIVNTHGHVDHIGANGKLKEIFEAPILLGEKDLQLYEKPGFGLSFFFKKQPKPDQLIVDGNQIHFGEAFMEVKDTPGHSPGSISLLLDSAIFCGDTLFAGSVGRTDLPGGSHGQLMQSIKEKIFVLNDHVIIYPGHGPATSVSKEIDSNPFIDFINEDKL